MLRNSPGVPALTDCCSLAVLQATMSSRATRRTAASASSASTQSPTCEPPHLHLVVCGICHTCRLEPVLLCASTYI